MSEENKLNDFESLEFEKFWEKTEIHKKAVSHKITGIMELAFKEVAMLGWKASSEVFRGPQGASG